MMKVDHVMDDKDKDKRGDISALLFVVGNIVVLLGVITLAHVVARMGWLP